MSDNAFDAPIDRAETSETVKRWLQLAVAGVALLITNHLVDPVRLPSSPNAFPTWLTLVISVGLLFVWWSNPCRAPAWLLVVGAVLSVPGVFLGLTPGAVTEGSAEFFRFCTGLSPWPTLLGVLGIAACTARCGAVRSATTVAAVAVASPLIALLVAAAVIDPTGTGLLRSTASQLIGIVSALVVVVVLVGVVMGTARRLPLPHQGSRTDRPSWKIAAAAGGLLALPILTYLVGQLLPTDSGSEWVAVVQLAIGAGLLLLTGVPTLLAGLVLGLMVVVVQLSGVLYLALSLPPLATFAIGFAGLGVGIVAAMSARREHITWVGLGLTSLLAAVGAMIDDSGQDHSLALTSVLLFVLLATLVCATAVAYQVVAGSWSLAVVHFLAAPLGTLVSVLIFRRPSAGSGDLGWLSPAMVVLAGALLYALKATRDSQRD